MIRIGANHRNTGNSDAHSDKKSLDTHGDIQLLRTTKVAGTVAGAPRLLPRCLVDDQVYGRPIHLQTHHRGIKHMILRRSVERGQ